MDACVGIGDEKAIKEAIIQWVEMCPKEECGIFGECNTQKQWSWNDFRMNLKSSFFVDKSVLYVLSRILSEPIGVFLENSTWTSSYLENETVGNLSILFALGCDKCFIPITRAADDEIEDLLEQCECMTEIATAVVFVLIVS